MRILAAAFFLMCLNQPSETLLIVLREGVLMFLTRTITAIMAVGGLWLGSRLGGVIGCAIALLAIQAFNLVALRIGEYIAEHRQHAYFVAANDRPGASEVKPFLATEIVRQRRQVDARFLRDLSRGRAFDTCRAERLQRGTENPLSRLFTFAIAGGWVGGVLFGLKLRFHHARLSLPMPSLRFTRRQP